MAGQTYTVQVNTNPGIQSIQKLQTAMGSLEKRAADTNKVFDRLKQVIGTIAVVSLVRQTQQLADNFVNLSRATGISVEAITAFSQAMATSGGTADRARDAISDLTKNIGGAVNGSRELQDAFRQAGVGLQELTTLSEQDIFAQTLQGLSQIPDGATRSAVAMKILGESVKGVDIENLNRQFGITSQQVGPYAEAIKSAAAANTSIAQNIQNFQTALINVLQPLNNLIANINISVSTLETLIKIVAAVGASFLIFTKVLPGIQTLTDAFYKLVTTTGRVSRQAAALGGHFGRFVGHLGRVITGAGQAGSRIASLGLAISQAAKFFFRFAGVAGIIYSVVTAVNDLIKAITGLDILGSIVSGIGKAYDYVKEKILGIQEPVKGLQADIRRADNELAESAKQQADRSAALRQRLKEYRSELDAVVTSYKQQAASASERYRIETELLGVGEQQRELVQQLQGAYETYTSERLRLTEQLNKLQASANQEDRLRAKEVVAVLAELDKAYAANAKSIVDNVTAREAKIQSQALETYRTQQQIQVEQQLRKVQDDIAKITLTNIEKGYYDIAAAARESARAAIEAEEARRKEKLDPAEAQEYYRKAAEGAKRLIQEQKKLTDQSRTFASGWERAFRQYVENARDAGAKAERLFAKFTQGLEDLIVDFAKTGRFEWKSFVDSLLEELLRSNIRELIAGLGTSFGLGNLFGSSGAQARGNTPNNPLYVLDLSGGGSISGGGNPGFGGNNPLISGGGIGGGQQQGPGILDSVIDFGKTVVSGVSGAIGSVAGGFGDLVGSAIGGIKNLFGGFFATGGMIPGGKFGIVGERGPEFVSGPAQITPLDGLGGGTTNVVYNINAVDAVSFQQLLARDPSFLYAVTEQGRKSLSGTRR